MIFSHIQKPLGMRKTRMGKRISVHGVPLNTSWFCPYCCATVDTAFASLRGTRSRARKATATSAAMLEGRFWFGIGSGENLNEHILGDHWPPSDVRLEMMEEAVQVIRLLWEGANKRPYGKHYTVENARLYTLPNEPPPIYVSAFGPKAIEVAARIGDGYVGTAPAPDLLNDFIEKAGEDKPRLGEMKVCWNEDESEARRMVHRLWPNMGLPGELSQELATPKHFEQAASIITEEMVELAVVHRSDDRSPVVEAFLDVVEEEAESPMP
jgi:G6PDH family F420-dependent oxidoreductase